jgi:hypothetical protein
LLANLHFLLTPQAKQKNAKEPSSNRTKTAVNMERRATTERTPAYKQRFGKKGGSVLLREICG